MLGEFSGLLVGFILGDGQSLVGVGLGGGEGLLIGGLGFVAFLGRLTHGCLLFFEGLLDGRELLGGFFLGALDAAVSEFGQLFVAASEGLEDILGVLLSRSDSGLLGVELGFQFGHAFGGGLAAGDSTTGRGEFGLGLRDLGVGSSDGGGDFGFGGSDLLGEVVGVGRFGLGFKGGAALFELGEGGGSLRGGAGVTFGEGGPEVRFGFGDLSFGSSVGTLRGGSAGFVEGLSDSVELGLGSGFTLGEGTLHFLGSFDDGGDVALQGTRSFEGFAVGLLHQALEFGFVAFRNGGFAGGGQLGQRNVHLRREAEVEGALVVRAEGWLEVGNFRREATLTDSEFVIGVTLERHRRRGAADGHTVQADRSARWVGCDRDRVNERGVNGGRATSDAGAKNEEGDGETHGAGIVG